MYDIPNNASYPLQAIMSGDYNSMQKMLESIESRIAERSLLEYQNIQELERMRSKLEDSVNAFNCFYQPDQTMLSSKSKIETEMIRLELRKNEEKIDAFRDVERLEAEKRKVLGDLNEESDMSLFSGGFT